MRIFGILSVVVMLFMSSGQAATVHLADGRIVLGDIVKQDSKSLQVIADGVTMTYYADEIKDVDGQPFGQIRPASGSPAAQLEAASSANGVSASAVIDPDKKALILKFIDVFGTRQALTNNFEMMLKQIEKDKPAEAQKIRDRVKIDEIIDRLLPVYDRNFSSEDLKAFIAFYGSDEGRKLITTMPELLKESVQESIKYMKEKFPEIGQGQQ